MVHALSHDVEEQSTDEKMGGRGGRGISGIIYFKSGLDRMFDSKRVFLLLEN